MIRRPPTSTLSPYTPPSRSAHPHPPAAVAQRLAADALGERYPGHVADLHREEHHALVQHLVEIGRARLNSSHSQISYAVFCLKKKKKDHDCELDELSQSATG